MKYLFAILLVILLTGCESWKVYKPQPSGQPADAIPMATPRLNTDTAENALREANARIAEQERQLKAQVKANVQTARQENLNNPDGDPKTIVDGELSIAETHLANVEADAAEIAAGATRKALIASGKAEEARRAYDIARGVATQAASDLETARSALAVAQTQRDEALARERRSNDEYVARTLENQKKHEAAVISLKAEYDKKIEDAKNGIFKMISRVLIGLGALFIIGAALTAYSGVQSGSPFKAGVRAAVFGVCAACCFGAAWTMAQPWFPYVIYTIIGVIIIAVGAYFWSEWKEGQEKKALLKREVEADEAETTLKKVMKVIDEEKPKDAPPIFAKLGDSMDRKEKALIHELKAEDQRGVAGTTSI